MKRGAMWLCLWLFFLIGISSFAQESRLRLMEYNVENLFDTIASPKQGGGEFTPQGSYHWNSPRYWSKLARLSRVIAAAGEDRPVDLVALIEVENDSVVANLTQRTKLWRMGYEYVITHSADVRGINVALLYQPHRFRPIGKDSLRVLPVNKNQHCTRDVLHVAGELTTGDTLDVFVCHLPSRRGGRPAMAYRSAVGRALRTMVDSVMHSRARAHVVLTGDFNSYYPEPLFERDLGVRLPSASDSIDANALYLLSNEMRGREDVRGTYKFQGLWNQLDQFIVNGRLLQNRDNEVLRTSPTHCRIVDFPFLLKKEKSKEGFRPLRTYLGTYYQGGYSDHLPLVLDIEY